jgi:hypothetical protein
MKSYMFINEQCLVVTRILHREDPNQVISTLMSQHFPSHSYVGFSFKKQYVFDMSTYLYIVSCDLNFKER